MTVSTRSITDAFVRIVGRGRVSDDPAATAAETIDGCTPKWVVGASSIEHIVGVLSLAHDEGLAVIPRGSGSALDFGNPPQRLDVVLDLTGLDRIVEYSPDDLTITVQAGVEGGALLSGLRERRQFLPVDPPEGLGRTIGGMVATNASGPLRVRYGTVRDLLLGVRFVQADGVVTWGGAKVVKSVTGYDVPKLMVGALGTLGVLAELTLRLHPTPEVERTWVATFGSPEAAQGFVGRVLDSTLQPSRVEFLNAPALRACSIDVGTAGIAITPASVEAAVNEQGEVIERVARAEGGPVTVATADFWGVYDRVFGRAPDQPDEVVLQIGTLASRLADTIQAIEKGSDALGANARTAVSGCASLGALRVTIAGAPLTAVANLVEALRESVRAFGGHIVIQRGPRELRTHVDPWGPIEPDAFALMRALKHEFDPTGVLNPGRFVGGL